MTASEMHAAQRTAFCKTCAPLGYCKTTLPDHEIDASANAPGEALGNYVQLPLVDPNLNLGYLRLNDNSVPMVWQAKKNVARLESTEPSDMVFTPSLLALFRDLPTWLGVHSIHRLEGDFVGYTRNPNGIPTYEIKTDRSANEVDPDSVAKAIVGKSKPLIYLTFPVTNPLQQKMSIEVVHTILRANPEAIVVVDNAYRRWGETPGLALLAQESDRVIYVDTAAKDLFVCGARLGWATASSALIQLISSRILEQAPYPVSPTAVAQLNNLLEAPEILDAMTSVIGQARDSLIEAARSLGFQFRHGVGPWILVYLGEFAADVVSDLLANSRIRVQAQDGSLKGWVRISATVPCEAAKIHISLAELVDDLRMLQRLSRVIRSERKGGIYRRLVQLLHYVADDHDKLAEAFDEIERLQHAKDWLPLVDNQQSATFPGASGAAPVIQLFPPK